MAADLGSALRRARRKQDLTLEQVAERSGLSVRTIGAIERGDGGIPLARTITALADALGVEGEARGQFLSQAREHRRAGLTAAARSSLAPPRLPDFTGRTNELRVLNAHRGGNGTVVISGSGGVGKTSLAVQASAEDDPQRPRFFVDLDGLGPAPLTPLQVFHSLLRQADHADAAPSTVEEATSIWRGVCKSTSPVVVLDSARDEEQIAAVVEATEAGRVIVTSRRLLGSLSGAASVHLDALSLDDALALLGQVIPATQRDERSLIELAQLSGGMPLALRIAGNRIASRPHDSASRFAERIGNEGRRLRSLVAGDLSIEATFSLSYADLTPDVAHLFRLLGVLDGPTFDENVAAATFGGDASLVAEQLDELVGLGLLESRGQHRYRMHDLIRLFASARLDADEGVPARNAAAERLHGWLLRTLERAGAWFEPARDGSSPVADALNFATEAEAKDWLFLEVDHWWPAYLSTAAGGRYADVIDSADALHWFSDLWMSWGHWHDFYRTSAEAAVALSDPIEEAKHLGYLAWAELIERSDYAAGLSTAERALAAAVRSGDEEQLGWAEYYVAWACRWLHDYERAAGAIRRAIRHFAHTNDREALTQAMFCDTLIQSQLGGKGSGLPAYEELVTAIRHDRELHDSATLAFAQVSVMDELSAAQLEVGLMNEALATAEEAFALAQAFNSRLGMATSSSNMALAHNELGNSNEALEHAARAYAFVEGATDQQAARVREELAAIPLPSDGGATSQVATLEADSVKQPGPSA